MCSAAIAAAGFSRFQSSRDGEGGVLLLEGGRAARGRGGEHGLRPLRGPRAGRGGEPRRPSAAPSEGAGAGRRDAARAPWRPRAARARASWRPRGPSASGRPAPGRSRWRPTAPSPSARCPRRAAATTRRCPPRRAASATRTPLPDDAGAGGGASGGGAVIGRAARVRRGELRLLLALGAVEALAEVRRGRGSRWRRTTGSRTCGRPERCGASGGASVGLRSDVFFVGELRGLLALGAREVLAEVVGRDGADGPAPRAVERAIVGRGTGHLAHGAPPPRGGVRRNPESTSAPPLARYRPAGGFSGRRRGRARREPGPRAARAGAGRRGCRRGRRRRVHRRARPEGSPPHRRDRPTWRAVPHGGRASVAGGASGRRRRRGGSGFFSSQAVGSARKSVSW